MRSTWYDRMIEWRERHISEKHLVLLLSFFVGAFSAAAAALLKTFIHLIQKLVEEQLIAGEGTWWYLITPVIGITLAALFVKYIVRDDISHGITKILYAISQRKSIIKAHNMWSSVVGSGLTIGFGGSVGAEAPIVLTGAAIGSNLAKAFRLDQKTMMLMIGCGAAGAIGGIFKAPIAGLVFTLEVLMMDLTMTSVAPLLISSVTATAISYILTGVEPMFPLNTYEPFLVHRIPWYLILGAICGLVSLYFTRGMNALERWMKTNVRSVGAKIVAGGLTLSILIFLFPPLYGEGYDTIRQLINGDSLSALLNSPLEKYIIPTQFYAQLSTTDTQLIILVYFVAIIFLKIFASVATNGGGGCGGIFAPSLFLGCICGFIFCRLWNIYDVMGIQIPERNFAMLGMCGLMSGVMHAPLTGIFLIAELTGGYQLFMPLMVVSVMAYLTIKAFEPHSIYAMRLAQRGELLTHHTDKSILTLMSMDSVIQHYDQVLYPDMTLGDVAIQVSNSKNHVFPVVNRQMQFVAAVYLDDIRHLIFRSELYRQFTVAQLMKQPEGILKVNDSMDVVVTTFDNTHAWTLPVVDDEGVFVGFIRKSSVLTVYRQMLADLSTD